MIKVGVMLMGEVGKDPKRVKEVILEVEAKTKIQNICEYLLDMQKISSLDVKVTISRDGSAVSEQSTIAQALKYVAPVDGLIRFFLYEHPKAEKAVEEPSQEAIHLASSTKDSRPKAPPGKFMQYEPKPKESSVAKQPQ